MTRRLTEILREAEERYRALAAGASPAEVHVEHNGEPLEQPLPRGTMLLLPEVPGSLRTTPMRLTFDADGSFRFEYQASMALWSARAVTTLRLIAPE